MDKNFTEYMLSFYGKDGVYPYGFTREQINLGTQLYKTRIDKLAPFVGDSVDRERVRDLILNSCYPELV